MLVSAETEAWEQLRSKAESCLQSHDAHPIPFVLLTRRALILHFNQAASDFLGLKKELNESRSLSEFAAEPDRIKIFRFLTRCAHEQGEARAELLLQPAAGTARQVQLIAQCSRGATDLEPTFFRVAILDLTRRDDPVNQEFGLSNWKAIVDAVDGIVWEADYPMRFRFVSPQAERLLGYPPRLWAKSPDFWETHIYHEDRERVVHERQQALRRQQAHILKYRLIAADRRVVWVKDSTVVLSTPNGTIRLVGIITDITELEGAREQLRRHQRQLETEVHQRTHNLQNSLKAMETFCYGIAHDLSGPLRTIQGFTALLINEHQGNFDAEGRDYADRIRGAVDHLANLIQALLVYGRLSSHAPLFVPTNVKEVLNRVATACEADLSKANAKLNLQMDYPKVYANPPLLEQIMANLLSNALKFRRGSVRPEISVHCTVAGAAEENGHEFVRITVSDNGIGIDERDTDRIFGIFQKLHKPAEYPGTGMGLAIVKRAVELMNGQVGVYSQPGQGSSFWISLPLATEAPEQPRLF